MNERHVEDHVSAYLSVRCGVRSRYDVAPGKRELIDSGPGRNGQARGEPRRLVLWSLTGIRLPVSGAACRLGFCWVLWGGEGSVRCPSWPSQPSPSVTAELDTVNRLLVLTQLRDQAAEGAVLVIVTHDPAILEVSDSVLTFSPHNSRSELPLLLLLPGVDFRVLGSDRRSLETPGAELVSAA